MERPLGVGGGYILQYPLRSNDEAENPFVVPLTTTPLPMSLKLEKLVVSHVIPRPATDAVLKDTFGVRDWDAWWEGWGVLVLFHHPCVLVCVSNSGEA